MLFKEAGWSRPFIDYIDLLYKKSSIQTFRKNTNLEGKIGGLFFYLIFYT